MKLKKSGVAGVLARNNTLVKLAEAVTYLQEMPFVSGLIPLLLQEHISSRSYGPISPSTIHHNYQINYIAVALLIERDLVL